tara:strand:- start:408 stop:4079 length:3672 start_codon:yes stop_codon:yes gene_type:complete
VANTITVTYKVNEDGSLSKISKGADKAAKSTDKASKSSANYSKKQKGVAGATSNSTKSFSKMSEGMTSGLVPAYATLAANVFALSAAFGVLSRNDAIAKLEEGLEFTGRAAGRNLTLVADKLKQITDNAISAEQAMRTTAVGVSAGFSEIQMEGLAKVAKGAALALGRDMGDAMDRLTRGAAKLEPEILDELGIMVRLDTAVKNYAIAHSKASTELTQFERRQAFTNAIIEDGLGKYEALAEALDPSAYAQLSSTFSDLTKTGIEVINTFLGPFLSLLGSSKAALGAVAAAFGASIAGQIVGGLSGMAKASAEGAKRTNEQSSAALKAIKPNNLLTNKFNVLAHMTDRSTDSLIKMDKALLTTINHHNTSTKKIVAATAARNQLNAEIHRQMLAQVSTNMANAIGTLQEVGLVAGIKAHILALRELQAATGAAMASQTALYAVMSFGRGVMLALAGTAKFVGAAFLVAMPYIAIAIAAFAILSPLVKRLIEDNSMLGKQMKENEKVFDEFNKVSEQYAKTIPQMKDATQAWLVTLKPISGMLLETSTALQNAFSAANADKIMRIAKAQKMMAISSAGLNAGSGQPGGSGGAGLMLQFLQNRAMKKASKLTEGEIKKLDETAITAASSLMGSLSNMNIALADSIERSGVDGAMAMGTLTQAQASVSKAFDDFIKAGGGKEAYVVLMKVIGLASDQANSAVNSFETFSETILAAKKAVGDPTATWGVYSTEIDNVTEALNKVNSVGKEGGPTKQMAADILEAYGIKDGTIAGLEKLKQRMEALNIATKANAMAFSALAVEKAAGGNPLDLLKQEIDLQIQARENASESVSLALEGTPKKTEAQKAFNVELAKELELIRAKFDLLATRATDSGMGAAASAAIAGQGKISAAGDEGKSAAITDAARETMRGVSEDLKNMGPEGATMGNAISGVQNFAEAFTVGMEVVGDTTAEMGTRVQAGLGIASSMIAGLSALTKSMSADKIRGIDQEIAAEKARDGQSSASVAKLKALEAKKTAAKKKAFEIDKKMKMAQTVISTAQGVSAMLGAAPPPFNFILAGMVGAMGLAQLAMIKKSSFQGGASGGGGGGAPSGISMGSRNNTVDLAKGNNQAGETSYARGASGQGQMQNFTPAFTGYKNRAAGGPAGFVVGEQGPELFVPEVPGNIVPAGQTAAGGAPTNVNFSIQAVDAEGIEDLLMNQRANIIRMIREAANEQGELFLEQVAETQI